MMDDRYPVRPYLRIDTPGMGKCGNCGRPTSIYADECHEPSIIDCGPDQGCGVRFTQITSPFERDEDYCRQIRPELAYVKLEWA